MIVDGDSDKRVVEICNHCWNALMTECEKWQKIDLPDDGEAVCFELQVSMRLPDWASVDISEQGFLVCFQGELRAWRNQCPHAGSPLDWLPGQFFSEDGQSLVCHTHHATFEPLSGACLAGPCPRGLYALPLRVLDGCVEVPLRIEK